MTSLPSQRSFPPGAPGRTPKAFEDSVHGPGGKPRERTVSPEGSRRTWPMWREQDPQQSPGRSRELHWSTEKVDREPPARPR